jgi:hypothetical protein
MLPDKNMRFEALNLPNDETRNIPGSATVPVAVFGVSPDTFPFRVHGEVSQTFEAQRALKVHAKPGQNSPSISKPQTPTKTTP